MSRCARLLPLSLGVLLACDGSGPTAIGPESAAFDLQDVTVAVEIDIQPLANTTNTLNLHARSGQIRVAVLGSEAFDPARIDYATVTFLGAVEIHVEPAEPGPNCDFPTTFPASHYTDVNVDLVEDALFHFATADLVLPTDLESGAVVYACISGSLIDDDPTDQVPAATFEGCADAVVRF